MMIKWLEKFSKTEIVLFLLFFGTYSYFYQGGFANLNSHFDLSLALGFEQRVSIDSFHLNTIDKVAFNHHYYSEKAPGTSYVAAFLPIMVGRYVSLEMLQSTEYGLDWLLYFSTVFSVSLLSALAAILFKRTLKLINPDLPESNQSWFTAITFLGTLALPYSTVLFSHQISASLLIIGLYLGLSGKMDRADFKSHLGAFTLGFAVITEYPVVILVSGVLAVIAQHHRWNRKLLLFAPVFCVPGLLLMIHNWASFGNPFSLGYGKLEHTLFSGVMNQGFFGIQLPRLEIVIQLLAGRFRGLLIYSPWLVIALLSFFFWPRKMVKEIAAPLLCAAALLVLLNSSYGYWQGGVCFGPRHLVPLIPLLALGLAYFPQLQLAKWIAAPFALLSFIINLVATSTTLFVTEFDTNPLIHIYWNFLQSANVSLNPVQFTSPEAQGHYRWAHANQFHGASFNWGEKIGLSGWISLVPLALGWMIALILIIRNKKAPSDA